MKKRIISIFMVIALIISLVPMYVLAATPTPITVTADKASACEGETITYSIKIGAVEHMQGFEFKVSIPTGLTYVSATVATGLKETLGSDKADWTESSKKFIVAGGGDYSSSSETAIMELKCTVDVGATGTIGITLVDIDMSDPSYDTIETELDVSSAKTSITAAPKPATGISLNKTATTIYTGANETLIATVEPNDTTDTVTWTSSNTAVATVDTNGKVTAVATGKATITAKAGSKSATCVVTVENAPCTHTNKTNVDAKTSTCKEQGWKAYSKCNDCGQLFDKDGNEISAIPYLSLADHTPAQTATAEYLKSAATCTSPAVYYEHCSVCDEKLNTTFTSGSTVPHTESGWKSAADGHWKECTVCNQITTTKTAHNPDHTGHATEEYAIKCTECGYVIEAQLGHTHVFDKEVATDTYKVTDATCKAKATYYKSCVCGEKGTETFEYGELAEHNWTPATCTAPKTCSVCQATEGDPLGHTEGREWKYNSTSHWHVCTVCGAKTDEPEEHQFDGGKTCVHCGYTKGSTIVILDPADTDKPDLENPGTGAAVSGSSIGYACAALAAVSAIYVGAKKLAKKDEE